MGNNTQTEAEITDELENTVIDEEIIDEVEVPGDEAGEIELEEAAEADDELAEARALVEEFKEALQRERADFQNFRRRVEREKDVLRPIIAADIMKRFLPAIDDFERAIDTVPEEVRDQDWIVGIIQISRKFQNALEAEGVEMINPLGEEFDPNFHEAIGRDEPTEEFPSGHITVVLQKGYVQGDKVLRAAMVRVAD